VTTFNRKNSYMKKEMHQPGVTNDSQTGKPPGAPIQNTPMNRRKFVELAASAAAA